MKRNLSTYYSYFHKRHWSLVFSGVFCIALDQLLKFIAQKSADHAYYLISHLIGWEYFENPGIAFGIPLPQFIVIPLSIIIIILGIILLNKGNENKKQMFGASLLIAGALSNLIDRILYGITIDYIRIITSIFNLADLAIVIGGIILISGNKRMQ